MPIPDYQELLLPVLQLTADGTEHQLRDMVEYIATRFQLTADEQSMLLPSGVQTVLSNRVSWARTYLKQAGLVAATRRGYLRITERGLQQLRIQPSQLTLHMLEQFAEYREFKQRRRTDTVEQTPHYVPAFLAGDTPDNILESAYRILNDNLAQEVLETVKDMSPVFFERLVVDLLVKMGYGGNRHDAGQTIGKSGDGGIDGFIKEDPLGLDVIYLQAKRWEGTVGRPEVQKFAGALQGKKARKGIFITTSSFTREATEYARFIDVSLILIDGDKLAQLMVEHNVGVSVVGSYDVKKLDSDYFEGG